MHRFVTATFAAAPLAASAAAGTPVEVVVNGFVEFNQISDPPLGNVTGGADATITFTLDSDQFADGTMFPTRGYQIENATFQLAAGAETLGLESPFPAGQRPYFILRDNDPAVDGFFLDLNPDAGFPTGVPLEQTGIFGQFLCNFSVTYDGATLPSLDILDAVGSYDFTGLSVFNFTIDDGPFNAMGLVFDSMTITAISACPWDCGDGNGTVDTVDFLALLADWGLPDSPCDFDGNGTVDTVDFLELLANWGACP